MKRRSAARAEERAGRWGAVAQPAKKAAMRGKVQGRNLKNDDRRFLCTRPYPLCLNRTTESGGPGCNQFEPLGRSSPTSRSGSLYRLHYIKESPQRSPSCASLGCPIERSAKPWGSAEASPVRPSECHFEAKGREIPDHMVPQPLQSPLPKKALRLVWSPDLTRNREGHPGRQRRQSLGS